MVTVDLGLVAVAVALVIVCDSYLRAKRAASDAIATAIREAVDAAVTKLAGEMRYRTKAATNRLKPPKGADAGPATPPDTAQKMAAFSAWLASQSGMEDAEREHVEALYETWIGVRKASSATREAIRRELEAYEVPLG